MRTNGRWFAGGEEVAAVSESEREREERGVGEKKARRRDGRWSKGRITRHKRDVEEEKEGGSDLEGLEHWVAPRPASRAEAREILFDSPFGRKVREVPGPPPSSMAQGSQGPGGILFGAEALLESADNNRRLFRKIDLVRGGFSQLLPPTSAACSPPIPPDHAKLPALRHAPSGAAWHGMAWRMLWQTRQDDLPLLSRRRPLVHHPGLQVMMNNKKPALRWKSTVVESPLASSVTAGMRSSSSCYPAYLAAFLRYLLPLFLRLPDGPPTLSCATPHCLVALIGAPSFSDVMCSSLVHHLTAALAAPIGL